MRPSVTRRALLTAAAASTAGAAPLEKLTIVLDWFINPNHAALFATQFCGAFARAGLEVTLLAPADPNTPPRLVAAGQAGIAVSYQLQLSLLDNAGLDLVRIASLVDRPLNTLMTLHSSGIRTLAEMKGRKIGVSVGGVEEAMAASMLASAGLALSEVEIVQVNFDMLPALLTGRLDAAMGAYRNEELIEAQAMGRQPLAFLPEAHGVPAYDELILVASRNSLARPALRRCVSALREGSQYLRTHPDEVWAGFSAAYPALNTATNRAVWAATLPVLARDPAFLDTARYAAVQAFLLHQGVISRTRNVTDIATDLMAPH